MKPVKLEDIVIGLETNADEYGYYLNAETGKTEMLEDCVYYFLDEYLDFLCDPNTDDEAIEALIEEERINDITGEWDAQNIREYATATFGNLSYIEPLGSHEQYRVMEDFIGSIEDDRIRNLLYVSIEGKGAFRRFKDSLAVIGQLEEYFAFHDGFMRERAREWCEISGVPYTE